jgi:ABC-2 type transport system permease protein
MCDYTDLPDAINRPRQESSVHGMAAVVLFPLTFLSNAFVPVRTLPGWLQVFVRKSRLAPCLGGARVDGQ